MHQYSNFHA